MSEQATTEDICIIISGACAMTLFIYLIIHLIVKKSGSTEDLVDVIMRPRPYDGPSREQEERWKEQLRKRRNKPPKRNKYTGVKEQ